MTVRVDIAIVGGQKCGTTTLYRSLARHRDVFAPSAKESRAFTLEDDARDAALHALYNRQTQPYSLHAYAHAWSIEHAIESMYRHNPAMHLVALTRDPVQRVWSAYNFACANGWETLGLQNALAAESERRRGDRLERIELQYVRNSSYDEHLARLHRYFPDTQVHVLRIAELGDASAATLAPLLASLGLDTAPLAPLASQNTASRVHYKTLQRWILGESPLKRAARKTVSPRWKGRIHRHLTAPLLAWNRRPAAAKPLTDTDRALITAALAAS